MVTRRVDGVELPVEVAHGDDVPPVDAQRRASVGRGEGVPGVDVEPTVSKRERGGLGGLADMETTREGWGDVVDANDGGWGTRGRVCGRGR